MLGLRIQFLSTGSLLSLYFTVGPDLSFFSPLSAVDEYLSICFQGGPLTFMLSFKLEINPSQSVIEFLQCISSSQQKLSDSTVLIRNCFSSEASQIPDTCWSFLNTDV